MSFFEFADGHPVWAFFYLFVFSCSVVACCQAFARRKRQ